MNSNRPTRRLLPSIKFQPLRLPNLKSYNLIELALMHESYINETLMHPPDRRKQKITEHRRLAYLGDSIMNAAVTDYLFEKFPLADQGVLTKVSEDLKSRDAAGLYAQAVGLDRLAKLGNGVRKQDKAGNLFGEMFEALIGAIYWSCDREFGLTCNWFLDRCTGVIEDQLQEHQVLLQT